MTPPEITSMAIAACALITAIFTGVVNILTVLRAEHKVDAVRAQAIVTDKKADTIIEKAVEIHAVTNSQLSRVTAALDVANTKIDGMQLLIGAIQETKKMEIPK